MGPSEGGLRKIGELWARALFGDEEERAVLREEPGSGRVLAGEVWRAGWAEVGYPAGFEDGSREHGDALNGEDAARLRSVSKR